MKGIPSGRRSRIDAVTRETKRVLLQTKSWERTKEHMNYWIRSNYNVSRITVLDYMETAAARLMTDTEAKELIR